MWRVLADPVADEGSFVEAWYPNACAAYTVARRLESEGFTGIEVNRCRLRAKVSRIDLLNRTNFLDESSVVPVALWKNGKRGKRARYVRSA